MFWCTADVGWVTGHTYIAYGPLAVGATQVVFEGVPTYPDAGRFWKMIQDHKVTVFYTAPTAIRSLIKAGGDLPKKYDLRALRLLGSVGEPINPEAWMWYYETWAAGRCPDRGHLVANRNRRPHDHAAARRHAAQAGFLHLPLPGIIADIVDETGHDVERARAASWSSSGRGRPMIRTIWGDPERFKKSYYPEELPGQVLPRRRSARPRRGRLFPDHGPHRRRAQRLRAPPGHHGNRVARWWPTGWSPRRPWWAVLTISPAKPSSPSWC